MGAYAPVPFLTEQDKQSIIEKILHPAIRALEEKGTPFRGALYAGLILTDKGPFVLEFNARFGDPETQAILPLLEEDIVPLLIECAEGNLRATRISFKGASMCVVISAKGYPREYPKGLPVHIPQCLPDNTLIFFAGVENKDGKLVSSGGRILNVVGLGEDLHKARQIAYSAVEQIHIPQSFYRTDIGYQVL